MKPLFLQTEDAVRILTYAVRMQLIIIFITDSSANYVLDSMKCQDTLTKKMFLSPSTAQYSSKIFNTATSILVPELYQLYKIIFNKRK